MSIGSRYILGSVTLFAFVSLSVKALSHLPFEQVVFWRAIICLALSYSYLKWIKIPIWGQNKKLLILRGLAGTLALSCFFYSLHHMPLATAVTVQYLSPLFTVMVAGLVFREPVKPIYWISSLVGFVGVYIIQGFDDRVGMFEVSVGVLGALSSAFAYNSVRALRGGDHEGVVIFYFPLVASVLLAPFAYNSWVWPKAVDWPLILVVGVLTQFAQVLLTKGYQADAASKVASISYVGVIYAAFFGVLLFDEKLSLPTWGGIALIILSNLLVLKVPSRKEGT